MNEELENKMLLDSYWESNEKADEKWERFCEQADDQYDSRWDTWQS